MKAILLLALFATLAVSASAQRPASTSICDYYAGQLNMTQLDLVKAVVNRAVLGGGNTVTGLVNLAATKNYFNGVVKYRDSTSPTNGLPVGAGVAAGQTPDFTTNNVAFSWLADHLYRFFGVALGCSSGSYPPYVTIGTQYAIHRNMNITAAVFNAFNGQVAASASSFGVATADVQAVGTALMGFARSYSANGSPASNAICWGFDCPCANGNTGATCNSATSTASFSLLALAVAAFVALFSARV